MAESSARRRRRVRGRSYRLLATMLLAVAVLFVVAPSTAATRRGGRGGGYLYTQRCARCHGPTGRGDGADAALFATQPRDLRSGFLRRYPDADLVARIREGTRLDLTLDAEAMRARAGETEALAGYLERLPAIDWRVVERGEELFVDRCEICHGPFGRPTSPPPPGVAPPPDLSAPEFQARRGAVERVIREGHGAMPGLLPRVEPADAPAVAAFVRLLSPGFALYARYCAACHGDDGRGAGLDLGAEGLRAPSVVFDRTYFARHDDEHVRATVWHMLDEERPRMPHLRETLTEANARAIIAYLKRLDVQAP